MAFKLYPFLRAKQRLKAFSNQNFSETAAAFSFFSSLVLVGMLDKPQQN